MISPRHRLLAANVVAAGVCTQTAASPVSAPHTSEVPYALNTLAMSDRPFTAANHKVADMVSSYWVNFAASGDPNGKGLPAGPVADGKNWLTMELGERPRAIPIADSADERAFHERVLARR